MPSAKSLYGCSLSSPRSSHFESVPWADAAEPRRDRSDDGAAHLCQLRPTTRTPTVTMLVLWRVGSGVPAQLALVA